MIDDITRKARNCAYVAKSRLKRSPETKKLHNTRFLRAWKPWITMKVLSACNEDKIKGRAYNITSDYVKQMLDNIYYKCVVSGVPLTHDQSLFSMSIDRIDNSVGHVIGNVQMVCKGINLAKNRHTNNDINEFIRYLKAPDSFKPERLSRDYISTCRRNAYENDKRKGLINNLTTDQIITIWESQNKKCFFSGIEVACYSHPTLSLSIDRIDNNVGHVIGNVRIVAKAINRAKSRVADDKFTVWLNALRGISLL